MASELREKLIALLSECVGHCPHERNHPGLDNNLIVPIDTVSATGPVVRRARLGGLRNFYCRKAA